MKESDQLFILNQAWLAVGCFTGNTVAWLLSSAFAVVMLFALYMERKYA
jgi:hypothetical protein